MADPSISTGPLPNASEPQKRPHPTEQRAIRRRNRLINSCLECRRRKLKCDKLQPCGNCSKASRECNYLAPALDPAGQAKLAEVKEKMGMLERALEENVAKKKPSDSSKGVRLPGEYDSSSDDDVPDDEKHLEPNPLITEDAAYFDDADGDLVDLGVQLGKMRLTDRIGGMVRPRFSEELALALKEVQPENEGPPSDFAGQSRDIYMAPGPDYVPPSSSFFFAYQPTRMHLTEFLPAKTLTDTLLDQYWRSVHVICRMLHRPSFERQYEQLWKDISMGVEPRVSFQAIVLAALLSAAISMPEERVLSEFGVSRESLVDNFKQGTEAALSRANFLRTTKIETLQAFVIYLIPLCRSEISRAHSALVGTVIRLAECMGLHRDPTTYGLPPVEVHVRRMLWHQICFLDIRTCEATGPRPQIRREDFDTKYPLNINDADLEREDGQIPQEDSPHFTDMTITRIRFECNEIHRYIWKARPKMARKKVTVTSVLATIQHFCSKMEKTYLPMLDKRVPLHFLATQFYGILSARFHVMMLSNYHSNADQLMPERLRQLLISGCIRILEHTMTVHQTPALGMWTWYMGALHQYHNALLLLAEFYAVPRDPVLEPRIWRCLDFTFDLPPDKSPLEKSRMIMREAFVRVQEYAKLRKMRTPKGMDAPGPRTFREGSVDSMPSSTATPKASTYRNTESQPGLYPDSHMLPSIMTGYPPPASDAIAQHTGLQVSSLAPVSMPAWTYIPDMKIQETVRQRQQQQRAQQAQQQPQQQLSQPPPIYPHYQATQGPPPLPHVGVSAYNPGFMNQPSPPEYHRGSDASGSSMTGGIGGTGGGGGNGGGGQPPRGPGEGMEMGMPEIDWNEWDQLFPPAQSNNDIFLPPYTFPQFSSADLLSNTDDI